MRRALSALVLAAAGVFLPAASAHAQPRELASGPAPGRIVIQLLDAPTSERANPRARLYIIDNLAPGTTIRRRIKVSNLSQSAARVAVYPAAAAIGNGSFTDAPARTPDALSQWTTVSRGVLSLAPGAKAIEVVTISVPRNASHGERYAVIWAQAAAPAPAGHITLVSRAGIRIYLSVGAGGGPPTSFVINTLTAKRSASGQLIVLAQVRNTGGRAVDLSGKLRISGGPGGLRAGPFTARLGTTLAPGQSEPVTVNLDKRLQAGPWRASIVLRSGVTSRRAEAIIQFPSRAGPPLTVHATPVAATSSDPTMTRVLVLVLALFAAAGLFLVRRRRGSNRASGRPRGG